MVVNKFNTNVLGLVAFFNSYLFEKKPYLTITCVYTVVRYVDKNGLRAHYTSIT